MIQTIKIKLMSGWHPMRWIRFIVGIILIVNAIIYSDMFGGFIGAFFLYQGITDTGCCGASGCALPNNDKTKSNLEKIEYTQIK